MNVIHTAKGPRLSITKDDFEWEYFTAGGHGGQKQNKTASACRCTHPPSGSVGISRDERSQLQNKKLAFQRCSSTPVFRHWCEMELARVETALAGRLTIDQQVERAMDSSNLKVETQQPDGSWAEESCQSQSQ